MRRQAVMNKMKANSKAVRPMNAARKKQQYRPKDPPHGMQTLSDKRRREQEKM